VCWLPTSSGYNCPSDFLTGQTKHRWVIPHLSTRAIYAPLTLNIAGTQSRGSPHQNKEGYLPDDICCLAQCADNELHRCVNYSFIHSLQCILLQFIYISQNIWIKNVEIRVFRRQNNRSNLKTTLIFVSLNSWKEIFLLPINLFRSYLCASVYPFILVL
jgi:hypothetical protein